MSLAKDNAEFIKLNEELETFNWFESAVTQKLDPINDQEDESIAIYMHEMRLELEEELETLVEKMQRKQKLRRLFTASKK